MTLKSYQAHPHPAAEPLYDLDPRTGASIEVFYADFSLARSFGGRGTGWFWWTCQRGHMPDILPAGPFATKYLAFRDATAGASPQAPFGLRGTCHA